MDRKYQYLFQLLSKRDFYREVLVFNQIGRKFLCLSATDSNKVSSLECLFYRANAATASGPQNQKPFSVLLGFRHIKMSFVFSPKLLYLVEGTMGLEHEIHSVSYDFLLE
jgi:hypothetical protein